MTTEANEKHGKVTLSMANDGYDGHDDADLEGNHQMESLLLDDDRPNDGRLSVGKSKRRWGNFFQSKMRTAPQEGRNEEDALLSSCPELDYTAAATPVSPSGGGGIAFGMNERMALYVDDEKLPQPVSDSGGEEEEEDDDDLCSDGDEDSEDEIEEPDLILFPPEASGEKHEGSPPTHSSTSNLSYYCKVGQENGSTEGDVVDADDDAEDAEDDNDDDDNDDDNEADDDECDSSVEESDSQKKDSVLLGFRDSFSTNRSSRNLFPRSGFRDDPSSASQFRKPKRYLLSRTVSAGSGYSDRDSIETFNPVSDKVDRKRINGRIEGIGSVPPPPDSLQSTRTLRERLQLFREGRMKKMSIGQSSWTAALENKMIDIVDAVLPPPVPEDDDDGTATKQATSMNNATSKSTESNHTPPASGDEFEVRRISRKAWGDDNTYIIYLERELRNRDLEYSSWKKRAMELDEEMKKLKGFVDADSTKEPFSHGLKEEGGSEIEWQTEIPHDALLIDLGGTYGGSDFVVGDANTHMHGNDIALDLFETNKEDDPPWQSEEALIDFEDTENPKLLSDSSHRNHAEIEEKATVDGEDDKIEGVGVHRVDGDNKGNFSRSIDHEEEIIRWNSMDPDFADRCVGHMGGDDEVGVLVDLSLQQP